MASSLSTYLGLAPAPGAAAPPSLGASYMIFNFLWAYAGISTRPWKAYYKLDHQVSPREDLAKYGPRAIADGKITQKQLDQIKRVEASQSMRLPCDIAGLMVSSQGAHANSVEHFPLLAASILWAHYAGLKPEDINRAALLYTLVRIVYSGWYILVSNPKLSLFRGVLWWTSNIICLRLIWLGGRAVNAMSGS